MDAPVGDTDLDALVRSSAAPLAVLDTSSSQLLRANEPFLALLRLRRADIHELTLGSLLPARHRPRPEDLLIGMRTGVIESWQGRAPLRLGDGSERDIRYRVR